MPQSNEWDSTPHHGLSLYHLCCLLHLHCCGHPFSESKVALLVFERHLEYCLIVHGAHESGPHCLIMRVTYMYGCKIACYHVMMNPCSDIKNGVLWLAVHCTPELETLADDVAHWVELALHKLGNFIQGPQRSLLFLDGDCWDASLLSNILETPGPVSPQERSLLQRKFGNGPIVGS